MPAYVEARWLASGRILAWPAQVGGEPFERYLLGTTVIHAGRLASRPPEWGTGWSPCQTVTRDGRDVAHVWRADDGSIFLPFNPDAAIDALLSEAYLATGLGGGARQQVKGLTRAVYYRMRPLLPRATQVTLRRVFSRIQRRQAFPRWPVENALHDLYEQLLRFSEEVAGEPVPWLSPWPRPFGWAFVLTHDVETQVGYANIDSICEQERALGYRSSWNLVPCRDYAVEPQRVAQLQADGWEVGLHGLRHDGRDLESARMLEARLPQMREFADRWGATGFRAPATQREWDLMPTLQFDHDSSYPDTDPFEPQGGGCCSLWPFFNQDLVELPITLPQDHTLFVILEEPDARIWLEKTRLLRDRGGMALVDTHPDYLHEEPAASAYQELLEHFADDETAWRALPSEVSSWWRDRARTWIERSGDVWRVEGPAADQAQLLFGPAQAANR